MSDPSDVIVLDTLIGGNSAENEVEQVRFLKEGLEVIRRSGEDLVWDLSPETLGKALTEATHACLPREVRLKQLGETPEQSVSAYHACECAQGRDCTSGSTGGPW